MNQLTPYLKYVNPSYQTLDCYNTWNTLNPNRFDLQTCDSIYSVATPPLDCCTRLNYGLPNSRGVVCPTNIAGPLAPDCPNILSNYCNPNSTYGYLSVNPFKDTACIQFFSNNKSLVNPILGNYCDNQDLNNNSDCLYWCSLNNTLCDNSMRRYCSLSKNINDPKCSCLNSVVSTNSQLSKFNPLCVDKKCIVDNGYYNTTMEKSLGSGCQVVDCNSVLNITGTGGNVALDNIITSQNCGTISTPLTKNTPLTSTNPTLQLPETTSITEYSNYIYLGVGIIILILVLFFLKNKKKLK